MSYLAPYVDSAGLHIPTYLEILEDLIAYYKTIYGQDCYLEEDSADYQWISIVALRIHDALSSIQLCYNNRAPATAIGSGLDQIVKMNGLVRKSATYSTCEVVLTGTIGTIITNGVVSDKSGYLWDLPATVTLTAGGSPETGQATVTATCQTIGTITALIGDICNISTPTSGWTAVTNLVAVTDDPDTGTAGDAVETDAELRARQTLSTNLPSMNLLTGTISAIAAMEAVTRYKVVENYTDEYDVDGNPPHSITCVVEGGTDEDVAETIWLNRGIGCYTNGTTTVDITDPVTGIVTPIRFMRPTYVPVYVTIYLEEYDGYTTATELSIKQAIVDYLNALQIGTDLTISALYAAAMEVTPDIHEPIFSISEITAARTASPQFEYNIVMLFNEIALGALGNIEIVAV